MRWQSCLADGTTSTTATTLTRADYPRMHANAMVCGCAAARQCPAARGLAVRLSDTIALSRITCLSGISGWRQVRPAVTPIGLFWEQHAYRATVAIGEIGRVL